jgi:hypothetical protein
MKRLAVIALALLPAIGSSQGLRITGVSSFQFVELRPLVNDSLLSSAIAGTGEWRTTAGGTPAFCPVAAAFCHFERSGDRTSAAPVLQDLTVAGWGWVQGLSFHADLRARTQLGSGGLVYPRSDDHFEVLDAYAELQRDAWRARVGRQWVTGGLGAYDFDGLDVYWRRDALSVEGWGGRALLGGLSEPYTSAQLAAVDNLPPSQGGYTLGARARYRPDPLTSAALTYQRVLIADRSGVYSERAALDASARRLGAVFDLGLTYDFAQADWNEARLRVGSGGFRDLGYSVEVRHSRPFFELWTIWGAFSPVAFNEARTTVEWSPATLPVAFSVRGAYRRYGETGTGGGLTLRTNGWRAGGDATWRGAGFLSVIGSYDVDIGSGAADSDGRLGIRWTRGSGLAFGADASVTQNIYEFRVGTGRIYGLSLNGAAPIGPDIRLVLDAGFYQHALTNGAAGPDWTQRRANMRLEWTLGRDPGAAARSP